MKTIKIITFFTLFCSCFGLAKKEIQLSKKKREAPKLSNELKEKDINFFKTFFKDAKNFLTIKIDDPISDEPVNILIYKVLDHKSKTLGYIRDIVTSTGCGGPCLPVIFTLFYNENGIFQEILSKKKLTKKNHVPFTFKDYIKLKEIILSNPEVFKTVGHPTEMTDAISGATKIQFKGNVVRKGAYTSLRVNTYNQHTLNLLSNYFKKEL